MTIKIEEEELPKIIVAEFLKDATFEAEIWFKSPIIVKYLKRNEKEIESDDRIVITGDEEEGIYKLAEYKKRQSLYYKDYTFVPTNRVGESKLKAKLSINFEVNSLLQNLNGFKMDVL